jgi:hypothetical protein
MKRYKLLLGIFFSLLLNSFETDTGNNPFPTIIEKYGIKFKRPVNTIEMPVINNDELKYQYALEDTVNKIEIRYLVYPLKTLVKQYNGTHSDTGISKVDPNLLHTNLLLAFSLKIEGKGMNTGGPFPEVKELSHATVDLEFNADWGGMVDIQPCDEFAQKYKYCTIFEIHKDDIADAFVIYLYDNKDTFSEVVKPNFHSLIFIKN